MELTQPTHEALDKMLAQLAIASRPTIVTLPSPDILLWHRLKADGYVYLRKDGTKFGDFMDVTISESGLQFCAKGGYTALAKKQAEQAEAEARAKELRLLEEEQRRKRARLETLAIAIVSTVVGGLILKYWDDLVALAQALQALLSYDR